MGVDNTALLFFGFKNPHFEVSIEDEDENKLEKLCDINDDEIGIHQKMSMGDDQYYLVSAILYRTESYGGMTITLPKFTETEMITQIGQYCKKHKIVFQSLEWHLVSETW